MFHFLAQKRLKRRGYSSGKKRRKTKESAWSEMLRFGWQVRGGIFVLFAILVSSWIVLASASHSIFSNSALQTAVVVFVVTATLCIHWHVSQPQSFRRNSRITLMLSVILIQLMLIKLSGFIVEKLSLTGGFELLIIPFVFAPMVISLLVGRQHGTLAVVYSSLIGGMMVPAESAFLFIIYSIICGFVAIYLTDRVRKRSRLVTAGIFAGLACAVLALTLGQIQLPFLASNEEAAWSMVGKQTLTAIFVSTLTAIVVSGMLPLVEGLFRITTDVSWIELADLNHPLLKRMTIEASGTYHHSLMVATLAETAAEVVGANAVMCRACSYFHDIGKMNKPGYFVENIGDGSNPHDDLTPTMSSLIVMAHVKDGVDMAIKHGLKSEIVDVIKEHHGDSLIKFFYHRALKQQEEIRELVKENKAHEEDVPEVKEEGFRYAGPRPRTRESAIISLADAVESASRSMKKPTPNKIDELIDDIFKDRLLDGQLDRAELTLADLSEIKKSFSASIRSMLHNRIEYPNLEKDKEKDKEKEKEKEAEEQAAAEKSHGDEENDKAEGKDKSSDAGESEGKEDPDQKPGKKGKDRKPESAASPAFSGSGGKAGDQGRRLLDQVQKMARGDESSSAASTAS